MRLNVCLIARVRRLLALAFWLGAVAACGGDDLGNGEGGSGHGGLGGVEGPGGSGGTGGAGAAGGSGGAVGIPIIRSVDPIRGPAGLQPVFIRGEGLGMANEVEVLFGSVRSSALEIAADQTWIRTAVPGGASTGVVSLLINGLRVDGPIFTVTDENPVPALLSHSPRVIPVGSNSATLTITGTGFDDSSRILIDGGEFLAASKSPTSMTCLLGAEFLSVQQRHTLAIENPPPGGGRSSTVSFLVNGPYDLLRAQPASLTDLVLTFDVPPEPYSAEEATRFRITYSTDSSQQLEVRRARRDTQDPLIVLLTTDAQEPGREYSITVHDLPNEFGGALGVGTAEFSGFAENP